MNWYLVKMLFQIVCGKGCHTPQIDEQIRIVEARDLVTAFHKSMDIGKKEDDCFLNESNIPVRWKFIGIGEVYLLNEMLDGAEMFSRIYEVEDTGRILSLIQQKADTMAMDRLNQS